MKTIESIRQTFIDEAKEIILSGKAYEPRVVYIHKPRSSDGLRVGYSRVGFLMVNEITKSILPSFVHKFAVMQMNEHGSELQAVVFLSEVYLSIYHGKVPADRPAPKDDPRGQEGFYAITCLPDSNAIETWIQVKENGKTVSLEPLTKEEASGIEGRFTTFFPPELKPKAQV